jgi:Tfp pilus assembly protein PilN
VSQQINLYQPALYKRKAPFSAWMICTIIGVSIVGLTVIYGFARWQIAAQEQQIVLLEQQLQKLVAQRQLLPTQQQPVPSRSLEQQLHEAEQELEQKQRLAKSLDTRPVAIASAGFSRHLAALARQRLDGLWLTQITVQDNGMVTLEGAAEAPELVPRYLTLLGREAAFSGTEFGYMHLVRTEEASSSPVVKFTVSTKSQTP